MLQLKGRMNSSNVMKALWVLDEIGLAYEREDVGGQFGKNHEAPYLTLNPNGRIPTIIDDDLVLWESNSIVRYLASKHSLGTLCPADPADRARCEMWMDWQLTELVMDMVPVFHGLVRKPSEERDMDGINAARDNWAGKWAILDDHLSRNTYVGGNSFTMADIPIGPIAYRWYELPIKREEFANLKRWYDTLCGRPAFRKHIMTGLS
ncbi:MAG: glutathione S-transferase family protein [Rhodospirillaceae bacterium]|nr:glutathione S-transferase [Rhodospirillaceae bacterium]RPF95404.1 MAG: glutathione S-transferase family protein [Rhodospirillaceae bacterium TMED63]RZO36586.1 MAG: glutathione S-transferase family protein [Rhodospirillaceae bacterium]